MKCTSCSANLPDTAKFCPECGAKVIRKTFCPECGAEATPGAKFCAECGTKLAAPQTAAGGQTTDAAKPKAASAPQESASPAQQSAPATPVNKPDPEWERLVSDFGYAQTKVEKGEWKGWSDISSTNWRDILVRYPELAGKCDKWKQFDTGDWTGLLLSQPQFADKCDKWAKFCGFEWVSLLVKQPQFADKCDWSKLKDYNWDNLLEKQPQLAKFRPRKTDTGDGTTSEFDPTIAGRVASKINAYMRTFMNNG